MFDRKGDSFYTLMATVTIFNHIRDISEAELIGILCKMVDNIVKCQPIVDIEISITKEPTLIPTSLGRSFTLLQKMQDIVNFCQKLHEPNGTQVRLEVTPVYSDGRSSQDTAYYIPENFFTDFMGGYMLMNNIFLNSSNSEEESEEDDIDYKDDWTPNSEFLGRCLLVNTPRDPINTSRNFGLTISSYLWDLPKISSIPQASSIDLAKTAGIYQEQLAANLIGLFLRDCSEEDHVLLMSGDTFLRFMLHQDEPDNLPHSHPYVHGYVRSISECTYPSHQAALRSCPKDFLPCEICYNDRGFFYKFPLAEWQLKDMKHIERFS